jgi:DNA-binding NarL/FixJ family response regulator
VRGTDRRTAVLADAHRPWLAALAGLLRAVKVDVLGTAATPSEAVALVGEHQPDILIAGLEFEDDEIDAWECLRRSRAAAPDMKMIVISAHCDPSAIELAFAEGASAYCIKSAAPADLAAAIRQSFDHSIYMACTRCEMRASEGLRSVTSTASGPGLTRRELEILQLVAEGHSNSQLAKMLWVTEQTVKFHLSNLYRKLDVANRTEASRWAQLHGVVAMAPLDVSPRSVSQ